MMEEDWVMSNLLDRLRAGNVDVETALRRFSGNEAMYVRYLLRFPDDENLPLLEAAVAAGDAEAARQAAHTLKGLSGNLGLTKLYEESTAMCALYRAGEAQAADAHLPALQAGFAAIKAILQEDEA